MQFVNLLLLTSAILVGSCHGWWWNSKPKAKDPEWNNLRVKFGINPFSSFIKLPRTAEEARDQGWKKDTTVGCDVAGTVFNGNRYVKDNDSAVMVLYDKNGYIAGLQAGIPKTFTYPQKQNAKYHVFHDEGNMWVITAYFTEPSMICTTGRTAAQVAQEGTGTMLAIQNGPTVSSLMRMPLDEKRIVPETPFVQGKCVYAMGMHYWYNLTSTMSCDDTFPMFPMYNKGRLNAFGWAFNPNYNNSPTWEHPEAKIFGHFMKDPPACLGAVEPVTTLHVYMTKYPIMNFC